MSSQLEITMKGRSHKLKNTVSSVLSLRYHYRWQNDKFKLMSCLLPLRVLYGLMMMGGLLPSVLRYRRRVGHFFTILKSNLQCLPSHLLSPFSASSSTQKYRLLHNAPPLFPVLPAVPRGRQAQGTCLSLRLWLQGLRHSDGQDVLVQELENK